MGPESVELYRTVTGVDSESHRLRIRLNGPCTEQAVDYSPDPEGRTLCQAFNERQKLRCSAVFSPSGAIERILRIDAASALELCAITVAPFQVDVGTIHLKEPLRLREQLGTAAESPVHVEYPDPNLLVFAEFQDNMEELVLNKLANKRQWIIESDDELTEYALEVKRQFLSIVEEG